MSENLLEAPERGAIEAVLKKSLSQAPTFETLLGFVCGAVITPGGFGQTYWLQPLFELNGVVLKDVEDIEHLTASVISLYDRVDELRLREERVCPFDVDDVAVMTVFSAVIDWATGLHRAVTLGEEVWITEEGEADYVEDALKKEVNRNIQFLTMLVDPASIPDIIEDPRPFRQKVAAQIPDWQEDLSSETWEEELKQMFQILCLCHLHVIVDTFQRYATAYDEGDFAVVDWREVEAQRDGE